jgi:four helix bundle protein
MASLLIVWIRTARIHYERAAMRNFRELQIWEKAHQFTMRVYTVTRNFPRTETYGLASQLQRSSSSIPTNISEGCGRDGRAEFIRFLHFAMGSANEADYQLLLSKDLGYLKIDDYEHLSQDIKEIQRMLASFIRKARTLPAKMVYAASPKT